MKFGGNVDGCLGCEGAGVKEGGVGVGVGVGLGREHRSVRENGEETRQF